MQRALRSGINGLVAIALMAASAAAWAGDRVRLVAQRTGTLAWELDVVKAHGLDRKAGITLEIVQLASPEAQKIALKSGNADVIVADLVWVARERALGGTVQFYPFSAALGAVMTPANSPLRGLAGLRGRKLAVGGGALDKNWILLRALALREGLDLKRDATPVYGAPPLLTEKALQGEVDAILNYWNFSAALEAKSFRTLVSMADVQKKLGASDAVAMIGYVFDGRWAKADTSRADRFLAMMRDAKSILAKSDDEWRRIAPVVRAETPEMLTALRERYREGIPRRPVAGELADAQKLFGILREIGGRELMGDIKSLEAAAYYTPGTGS